MLRLCHLNSEEPLGLLRYVPDPSAALLPLARTRVLLHPRYEPSFCILCHFDAEFAREMNIKTHDEYHRKENDKNHNEQDAEDFRLRMRGRHSRYDSCMVHLSSPRIVHAKTVSATMTLFLGVIIVLIIVAVVILARAVIRNREGFTTEDENGKALGDLFGSLKSGVTTFFADAAANIFFVSTSAPSVRKPIPPKAIPIFNAPFEGSLNELDLRTWNDPRAQYDYIIDGSGKVTPSVPIIGSFDVNYKYRLDTIYDLFKNLEWSAGDPTLTVSEIDANGNQAVSLRLNGHLGELRGKPTVSATAYPAGLPVYARCSDILTLKNVWIFFTFKFVITGCGTAPRIQDIVLDEVKFTFDRVDYRCSAMLAATSLYTLDLDQYTKAPILDGLNSQLAPVLKNLMRDNFSHINFPLLFCLRLPTGCIPGVEVGNDNNHAMPPILNALTFDQCKSICKGNAGCVGIAHEWGDTTRAGRCMMYKTDPLSKPPLAIPYWKTWIRKTDTEKKNTIPSPNLNPAYSGPTTGLTIAECPVQAANNGIDAWSYENGACSWYVIPYSHQKSTPDIFGKCGRNFKHPNEFVF